MTQTDKKLLLKELCARLPFGLICHANELGINGKLFFVNVRYNLIAIDSYNSTDKYEAVPLYDVKPYLRPMSSMTEEEVFEYLSACNKDNKDILTAPRYFGLDYLLSHHFDYHNLIPMGLALEAPVGMYKTE